MRETLIKEHHMIGRDYREWIPPDFCQGGRTITSSETQITYGCRTARFVDLWAIISIQSYSKIKTPENMYCVLQFWTCTV